MGFIKKAVVASAIATAAVAMVGQGGAFGAAAGGGAGAGTIAPGLTTVCTDQTLVTFDSAILVYADSTGKVDATTPAHFEGASDGCETLNAGQGHGNLTGGFTGTVSYQRTANEVTLSGTINGHTGAGVCIFVPLDVNPVDKYALACVAASSN